MTPTEALSQIYAMRESTAHGWKPNQDQQALLVLADMLDEAIAERNSWKYKHLQGEKHEPF